jgi:glycosyltransferase involved in cell wall biosynthesis
VLPSLSEGAARACLEALHLGVPCVVREVDGSAELIRPGVNGELFTRDGELAGAIGRVVSRPREPGVRHSLLPDGNRQQACARAFLDLVESGS